MREWVLMTEIDLTAKHHTGLFHGSTRPPNGSIISYQAIHFVYLHSGGVCAPTSADTPVAESLGVISWRRPSAYLSQHQLSLQYIKGSYHQEKKVGYSFWNKVPFHCCLKITDKLLIQLVQQSHLQNPTCEEGKCTLYQLVIRLYLQWLSQ